MCAACSDIDAGRFIDFVELDAASNRGVEEISRLLDQSVYKPVVGRFKVYLIDEVHMLSNHAFNAMLKTLEEPPEYLKFILATTDPQKVPATVLSRCLQFNLRPMAAATIAEHLAAILATENVAAEPGALKLIARAARGSMRDAQSLTDQAIAHGSGRVEEAGVRQMLGAVDRSHAVRCIEAAAARDGAALIGAVDGLRSLGLSAPGALEEMAALLQEMAVVQAVPDAVAGDDPTPRSSSGSPRCCPPTRPSCSTAWSSPAAPSCALAPDEYSGLVMVLLRMLAFAPADERAATPRPPTPMSPPRVAPAARGRDESRRRAGRGAGRGTGTALRQPTPPAPAPDATAAAAIAGQRRRRSLERAGAAPDRRRRDRGDGARAGAAVRVRRRRRRRRASQVWHLRVERENLRTPALRERLQAAAAQSEGRALRIEIEAGATVDTPAARDAAERDRRQAEAERLINDDPLVRALMAQYKTARIVPGSVKPH